MSTSSIFTSKFFVLSMFAKSSVYVSLVSECRSRLSSFISSTLISGRLSWLFSSFSSNSSCNCNFSLNLIISFANFVFCSFSFCLISYISFNIASSFSSSIILVFFTSSNCCTSFFACCFIFSISVLLFKY
uniref:Putative ovule protein n=1 Tax=Solanum chacoense TaxID=4108 RepID=A0A0V0H707_SOLCH